MNGLSIRVRTRTKVQDYRFIGQQPADRWWETRYGRWTDFSRPTVIVEPGRFFIAGIGSSRTDSKGAGIHYALLGEFEGPNEADEAAQLIRWVCEQDPGTTRIPELGHRLDQISEVVWSAALNGEQGTQAEVESKLVSLLVGRPEGDTALLPEHSIWIGKPNKLGFQELASTATLVVAKKSGLAAYLNLASPDELTSLRSAGNLIGLVCREGPANPKSFAPL